MNWKEKVFRPIFLGNMSLTRQLYQEYLVRRSSLDWHFSTVSDRKTPYNAIIAWAPFNDELLEKLKTTYKSLESPRYLYIFNTAQPISDEYIEKNLGELKITNIVDQPVLKMDVLLDLIGSDLSGT